MKYLLLLSLCSLLSCKSSSNFSPKEVSLSVINSFCPEDGKCTLRLEKNKSIVLKKDGIGKLYYELLDDTNKSVIIYEYSKNIPKDLQDASYREEVIFEIDNNEKQLNVSNENLRNTKMLFGKHCFCRGKAGYYIVKSGYLSLTNNGKKIEFSLNFSIQEVPQIIKNIQNKSPK